MGDTYRPVAALCAYLGLRISESLGIVWGDISLQARTLSIELQRGQGSERVRLKTPASRAVLSLPSAVVDELRAHRERQVAKSFALIGPEEFVFPTGERNNARRAVANAAKRAGLGAVTPHALRHSFVHAAHGAGLSIPAVASLARHKTPAVTMAVYSTLGDEERLEAAKALEASGYGG
jgi:integrase